MDTSTRNRRVEAGDTLVELLVAIVVLSVGVLGVYGMLTSTVAASARIKGRADVSQVVTRLSDAVARADWQCSAPPGIYSELLAGVAPSSSWTVQVESVQHWGRSRAFEDGCPAKGDDETFRTLKLGFLVKAPADRGQQMIELIKRP